MLSLKPQPPVGARRPTTPGRPGDSNVALAAPPLAATRAASLPRVDPDESNQFRKLVVYFGLATLFVRFSVLSELIAYTTGLNTYLLYVTLPPAFVAMLATGGLRRTFRQRAAYFWLALFGWMVLAIPFSYWPGGSTHVVLEYGRTVLPLLLIAGGLAVRWGEIRAVFYTIAAAALVNLLTSRYFMDATNGRISLTASGTIGNSNDLAAHLVLVLPFLLFVTMDSKRSLFIRIPLLLAIADGLRIILGTASRGALIAVIVAFVYMLWQASGPQRAMALGGGIILTLVFMTVLPATTLTRLGSLFGQEQAEAEESGASRAYLFRQSVLFTVQHPLFGVGPGQFANFEGNLRVSEGKIGNWHETHCVFTEVSSENGIPALIFFLFGLGSSLSVVIRTCRKARQQGDTEIVNACFCYLLSMVGFMVASSFLANAFHFYLPVMIGLAGSISFAANRRLEARAHAAATQTRLPAMG